MRSFFSILLILIVAVCSATVYAQSTEEMGSMGEGIIMKLTETMLVVDDLSMTFPDDLRPVSENGETLLISDLHVGDKVLYRTDANHVLVFIGKFNN